VRSDLDWPISLVGSRLAAVGGGAGAWPLFFPSVLRECAARVL